MQLRESLASFLPSGQAQEPPSRELRHTYSQSREVQRLFAVRDRKCYKLLNTYKSHNLKHITNARAAFFRTVVHERVSGNTWRQAVSQSQQDIAPRHLIFGGNTSATSGCFLDQVAVLLCCKMTLKYWTSFGQLVRLLQRSKFPSSCWILYNASAF
jgi:hypothetical protein